MTTFTLCFMTGRKDPRLDWVLEDIIQQGHPTNDRIEVLVVDVYARTALELMNGVSITNTCIERVGVASPMPNIWQGKHRVTTVDFWATATARNTALVLASHDYIAFLDDRCHLGAMWMHQVRHYEASRSAVLLGAYEKREDGEVTARDHRTELCPEGKRNCAPGWLYGCTFALPLDWALEVNGFEEGTNGLTGEDYLFGLMLSNLDRRCDFVPEMFVRQDRTRGNESCKGSFRCFDKGVSPKDKSHAALERFGKRERTEFTPDLRKMRMDRAAATRVGREWTFPIPDPNGIYADWFDGQDVRTM